MVVDQGIVDGNAFGNVLLHPADQLTGCLLQLIFRQKPEDIFLFSREYQLLFERCNLMYLSFLPVHNDNPILVERLKVARCKEGANPAQKSLSFFLVFDSLSSNQRPQHTFHHLLLIRRGTFRRASLEHVCLRRAAGKNICSNKSG